MPRTPISGGSPLTGGPPVRVRAIPRAMPYMPSVTIKAGTLSFEMMMPLMNPANDETITPPMMPVIMARIGEICAVYIPCMMSAETTAANPVVKPTERSIPPVMMTNVAPRANIRFCVAAMPMF